MITFAYDDDRDADAEWEQLPPVDQLPEVDRVQRAIWERTFRAEWESGNVYLPPAPPYDAPERLEGLARDMKYLRDRARGDQRQIFMWAHREQLIERALRRLVMAIDRGGSLDKLSEEARLTLEKAGTRRYRRPPR